MAQSERLRKPFKLCLFDDRRGQVEGEEADKILAFYPTSTAQDVRTSTVGLTLALIAFTSIFDTVSILLMSEPLTRLAHAALAGKCSSSNFPSR